MSWLDPNHDIVADIRRAAKLIQETCGSIPRSIIFGDETGKLMLEKAGARPGEVLGPVDLSMGPPMTARVTLEAEDGSKRVVVLE